MQLRLGGACSTGFETVTLGFGGSGLASVFGFAAQAKEMHRFFSNA
jgi:hypothetical protein